jgi:hypothetical protein
VHGVHCSAFAPSPILWAFLACQLYEWRKSTIASAASLEYTWGTEHGAITRALERLDLYAVVNAVSLHLRSGSVTWLDVVPGKMLAPCLRPRTRRMSQF